MRHARRPILKDLVLVGKRLDTDGFPFLINFDITQDEFYAIGVVTVQWAYLEHALFYRSRAIAKKAKMIMPRDTTDFSFTKRLRAFRQIVNACIKSTRDREYCLNVASAIGNAEGNRHRITHDLWYYNPKNPEQLWSVKSRPPIQRYEPFNLDKLLAFGERVGKLLFLLIYPPSFGGRTPSDKQFSYVSRHMLLTLAKTSPHTPDRPPATPQERKPPLPS
jgi:hypothetical protein